jgi:hypothetical protein
MLGSYRAGRLLNLRKQPFVAPERDGRQPSTLVRLS